MGSGAGCQQGLGRSPNGVLGESPAGFGAKPQLPAYMIQSSQPVLSVVGSSNLPESSLAGGLASERSEPERSEGEPRTPAHPAKLDIDKFGDEATRPNRWLD